MNSLVGYGVSSESDGDGDGEDVGSARVLCGDASAVKKTRNFLLESGSASSESDPEDGDPARSSAPPQPQKPASSAARRPAPPPPGSLASHKLPPPALNTSSDSGVFANPFKAQADRKLSALQKHVPLTMQAKPAQIGGKKVCVSYRKDGRCRFGIKCKFAHDSDLQTLVDCNAPAGDDAAPGSGQAEARAGGSRGGGSHHQKEEEESGGQQGKRRKVGLSNTLIPPKRAMKQYATQRCKEQLNMS